MCRVSSRRTWGRCWGCGSWRASTAPGRLTLLPRVTQAHRSVVPLQRAPELGVYPSHARGCPSRWNLTIPEIISPSTISWPNGRAGGFVSLAIVRDLRPELRLTTPEELAAFEQDLLSEFVLARASAGISDGTVAGDVSVIVEVPSWFARPLWEMEPRDLDRFFGRHQQGMAHATKVHKAHSLSVYFEFLELRHKPAIHRVTGYSSRRWMRSTGPVDRPCPGCGFRRRLGRSTICSRLGVTRCRRRVSRCRSSGVTPR